MLTNEQKALKQIITYFNQNKREQLQFYFDLIDPQWFCDQKHRQIFQALKYLTLEKTFPHPLPKNPSSAVLLSELLTYLQTHFPQDHFTQTSLAFLSEPDQTENNLDCLTNLKHTYTQEKLFQQLLKIIQPSFDQPDPYHRHLYYQEIFAKLRKFMAWLPHQSDQTLFTIPQMINVHPEFFQTNRQAQETIRAEYYRLSENFRGLNQATNGFKKGQVVTIGGYTGLGKTSFVYHLLLDISQIKHHETTRYPQILVFSYEMTLAENLSRLLANLTRIPLEVIFNKNWEETGISPALYKERMKIIQPFLNNLQITFSYDPTKTIDYVLDLVYRRYLEQQIDIVVIDHLQITKATHHFENDRLAIDEIMTKLKKMAMELKIVIIILSQFSRDAYSNFLGKSPAITALKGSGGIETNSDLVLMMAEFQPQLSKNRQKLFNTYNYDCQKLYGEADGDESQKIIELAIKKNRSGTKKDLLYHFEMRTQTFREIGYVLPDSDEDD
ncbi:DnaB helicase C-terminal domain-containing protein ['Crotalaria aegyptiaca' phytoplasma]|uniref:DnaB helicase C-terminal domain-containing protein n=1 Tax=Candidatus Phytoplasma crotalariae TaxID=2982627 RepID=A0ABT9D2Z5_9MOLU|nr:DnaB-like helicase C-terminal domain-containing protein ['Crotalaria aegyptiaca' phytoplasma]MDO8059353.1 DnaB helicase C-terminal domain-containing protein ['Crotalaria aegyptiaca' phytoplasma]